MSAQGVLSEDLSDILWECFWGQQRSAVRQVRQCMYIKKSHYFCFFIIIFSNPLCASDAETYTNEAPPWSVVYSDRLATDSCDVEKIQERASKSQKLDLYLADLPFKVIFLWTSVLLLESLLFLGHIEIISIGHGPLCRCLCGVCWIFSRASKEGCFNIFSQSQHNCRKVNLACKDWVGVAINSAFSCQNMMSLWHAPKFKSFLLNVLPQMLQDVTIEIYFDSLTLGDQFMVHNLVNVKKKMMSMLPVLLLTWRAAFRLGNGELFNKKLLHSHSWRPSSHQQW